MSQSHDLIEALEARKLMATFIVTTTADGGDGSLRDAIKQANTDARNETIFFKLSGSGVHTIKPLSALPTITCRIDIQGTTDADGDPLIELDGENAGGANGLLLNRNTPNDLLPSAISGLIVNRFGGNGIEAHSTSPLQI